jgi:hypothetical protein
VAAGGEDLRQAGDEPVEVGTRVVRRERDLHATTTRLPGTSASAPSSSNRTQAFVPPS